MRVTSPITIPFGNMPLSPDEINTSPICMSSPWVTYFKAGLSVPLPSTIPLILLRCTTASMLHLGSVIISAFEVAVCISIIRPTMPSGVTTAISCLIPSDAPLFNVTVLIHPVLSIPITFAATAVPPAFSLKDSSSLSLLFKNTASFIWLFSSFSFAISFLNKSFSFLTLTRYI